MQQTDPIKSQRTISTLLLISALVALSLLHTYYFRIYVTDDAFISFRYLENMLDGKGLVYNPGERVWGYTNFLWIALLAPLVKAGVDSLLSAQMLGVIFNTLSLLLVISGFRSSWTGDSGRNYAGGLILATSGPFLLQGLSGLETSLFTFLILWGFYLYRISLRRDQRRSLLMAVGVIFALAAMTRPEGLFLFGLLLFVHILRSRPSRAAAARSLLAAFLGFAPLFMLYEALMFSYYGVFWPNSINAKVGLSLEQLLRGGHYVGVFVTHYPWYTALLIAAGVVFLKLDAIGRLMLATSVFLLVFTAAVGGDWMPGYRLFHLFILLTCALIPYWFEPAFNKWGTGRPLAKLALSAAIILVAALNLTASRRDDHVHRAARKSYVHDGIKIGQWMRENLSSDAVLATNTGGSLAYFSKLAIVDMMGINDPIIANRRDVPDTWKGIEKGDGDYVLSRRPDYIQFGSSTGTVNPGYLSDIEIFQSEDFWKHYRLVVYDIDENTKLTLYKRRKKPRLKDLSPKERRRIRTAVERGMRLSPVRY